MNLEISISVYAGGVGSGCQGPNCGRHKVGDRVIRNPKVKQWKDSKHPYNRGVVLSLEDGYDNKDRPVNGYRFLSDDVAKDLKDKNHKFADWEGASEEAEKLARARAAKGTWYSEKELVPEGK